MVKPDEGKLFKKSLTTKERSELVFAYLINMPTILLILLLIGYPIGVSLWTSLHRYNLRRPGQFEFVGLGNYLDILTSYDFWHSIGVSLYFTGLSVPLIILVALGIALLFNQEFFGRGIVRSMLLIPWAIPGVVNGLMWVGLLGKYGVFDKIMRDCVNLANRLTGLEIDYLGMASPIIALNAAIAAHVWQNVPFACIIFLAAFQAIPSEQYRAAKVDGANAWNRFFHITLPWLLHPIMIVAILGTMNGFRTFDLIFTLTGGGPGDATYVIAWQTYKEAFGRLNFGSANAYSYLIMLITMSLAMIYIRLLYNRGTVQG